MKSDPKVFIPIFLISPIPFVTFTPPISPLYFIIFTLINMYIIAKIYKLIRQNMEIKKEHICESDLFIFILRLIFIEFMRFDHTFGFQQLIQFIFG